jgi:thioesterase domain-containing protein
MVDKYLPLLRHHQPVGPYHLGGHCNGALIALELAHRLTAAGQKVGKLILIDPPPNSGEAPGKTMPLPLQMAAGSLRNQPTNVRRAILNGMYSQIIRSHVPRTYDGDAILLISGNWFEQGDSASSRNWSKLLPNAQRHLAPGDHKDMFGRNLPDLAREIRNCLLGK